jgi:hypothetical protein
MPVVEDRPQHTPKGHPHRWMGQREGFKPISSSLGCVFPRNQRFVFECALFEDIKPGARLRGLDPAGIAEVVQVARFGPDALNLVFRVDGRVGERLVYRGYPFPRAPKFLQSAMVARGVRSRALRAHPSSDRLNGAHEPPQGRGQR